MKDTEMLYRISLLYESIELDNIRAIISVYLVKKMFSAAQYLKPLMTTILDYFNQRRTKIFQILSPCQIHVQIESRPSV